MDIGFIARCPVCRELNAIPRRLPEKWKCLNCPNRFSPALEVAQLIPLKQGDEVTILAGVMIGKTGTVISVLPDGDMGEAPHAVVRVADDLPKVRVALSRIRLDAIAIADGGRETRVPVHYPADWTMVDWQNWRESIERIGPGDNDTFAAGVNRVLMEMRAGLEDFRRGDGGEASNVWGLLASAIGGYQPLAISIDDSDGDRVITLRLEPEAAAETEQSA